MKRTFMTGTLLCAFVFVGGCGRGQAPPTSTADHPAMGHRAMGTMEPMGDACPMEIPGTTVETSETPEGVAMTFMTTGDVALLRARVHAMADRMNTRASGSTGMMTDRNDGGTPAMMGSGMGGGMPGMMMDGDSGMMPAMHAQAEDVEGGARLRAAPADGSRVDEMRQRMKHHAQMMREQHRCPVVGTNR
jgi:hypothetical protein